MPDRTVINEIARRRGMFTVSLRWRDDWLRARCAKLKKQGLLRGGKRVGGHFVFYPTSPQGRPGQAEQAPVATSTEDGAAKSASDR